MIVLSANLSAANRQKGSLYVKASVLMSFLLLFLFGVLYS